MSATVLKRGLVICMIASLTAITAGCGSDDAPTNSVGSLTDPSFVEVQGNVDAFVDSAFISFSAGFSSYNEVPITNNDIEIFYGPVNPSSLSSSYEYTASGWHHITVTVDDVLTLRGVNDSIQFRANGVIQQESTGADVVDYRHHWSLRNKIITGDYTNEFGDVGFVFSQMTGTSALINGSYTYRVLDQSIVGDTTTVTDFTFTSNFSGVQVNKPAIGDWASGCPVGGGVNFGIDQIKIVEVGVTIDTATTAWTGSATFNNGAATISLTTGTTTWRYTKTICAPAQ